MVVLFSSSKEDIVDDESLFRILIFHNYLVSALSLSKNCSMEAIHMKEKLTLNAILY